MVHRDLAARNVLGVHLLYLHVFVFFCLYKYLDHILLLLYAFSSRTRTCKDY